MTDRKNEIILVDGKTVGRHAITSQMVNKIGRSVAVISDEAAREQIKNVRIPDPETFVDNYQHPMGKRPKTKKRRLKRKPGGKL